MLDVTLDLITQTASSSLFAFCFCNLIIVIILVGSKPGSEFGHEEKNSPLLEPSNTRTNDDHEEKIQNPKGLSEERDDLQVVSEVENAKRLLVVEEECVSEDKDEGDKGEEDEDGTDDDDDDDDELRKRVEEFIQKVNRAWKAELLRNSNSIEA